MLIFFSILMLYILFYNTYHHTKIKKFSPPFPFFANINKKNVNATSLKLLKEQAKTPNCFLSGSNKNICIRVFNCKMTKNFQLSEEKGTDLINECPIF